MTITELQHYGSQTNLIDFTADYHIALFFACNGSHDKDGRIILLKRTAKIDEKYQIKRPRKPLNRVMAQKSVFAQPPQGFIDPSDLIIVNVPADLKQWILIYLRNFQDISTESIYNDIYGFIRHKNLQFPGKARLQRVLAELHLENTCNPTDEERKDLIEKKIEDYIERLQYAPYEVKTYVDQGQCYLQLEQFDLAVETFSKAILLKPDYADAYSWRGFAFYFGKQINCAKKDFDKTKELNPHYFTDIEERLNFKLPEDLVSILT